MTKKFPRTLILGWPVWPAQSWLANYPDVTAARIYQEGLPHGAKRWMNASFHMPARLQVTDKLRPQHWYGDWSEDIRSYELVILIDEIRGRDIFEFILERNPRCKLVVFYDHAVEPGSRRDPRRYHDLPIYFCTCDRKVAATYHIDFQPYFYIFSPYDFSAYATMKFPKEQGVFFLGEEKGDRIERLAAIREMFESSGIPCDLHLVRKRHGKRYTKAQRAQACDYMPYAEAVEHIKSCRAILELVSDGQTGITQRPYEALFFRKKLITTSEEVCRYDFCRSGNVFVLEDDLSNTGGQHRQLLDFLQKPATSFDGRERYSLEAWIRRLHESACAGE